MKLNEQQEKEFAEVTARVKNRIKSHKFVELIVEKDSKKINILNSIYIVNQNSNLSLITDCAHKPTSTNFTLWQDKHIIQMCYSQLFSLFKEELDFSFFPGLLHKNIYAASGKLLNTVWGCSLKRLMGYYHAILWNGLLDTKIANKTIQIFGINASSISYSIMSEFMENILKAEAVGERGSAVWGLFELINEGNRVGKYFNNLEDGINLQTFGREVLLTKYKATQEDINSINNKSYQYLRRVKDIFNCRYYYEVEPHFNISSYVCPYMKYSLLRYVKEYYFEDTDILTCILPKIKKKSLTQQKECLNTLLIMFRSIDAYNSTFHDKMNGLDIIENYLLKINIEPNVVENIIKEILEKTIKLSKIDGVDGNVIF